MVIARTTDTAKFRKLIKWQHFEVYMPCAFRPLSSKQKTSDFEIPGSCDKGIYKVKTSSKFQVNRSTKT